MNSNTKRNLKRDIYADALKAMKLPVLLHSAVTCTEGLLTVFTASILGQFADSVFRLDLSLGARSAVSLGLALAAMILLLPAVTLIANRYMLKYSLVHDRMVLGRFLDKSCDAVLGYEPGDIQNRLDWDPTNLRCYLVEYLEKGFMLPVTLAFLLFHALKLSPFYTLIVFTLSLLKLTVPLAVKKLEGRYDREKREYASRLRSLETDITRRPCMIKLYGLEESFQSKAKTLYRTYYDRTEKKSIFLSSAAEAVSSFTGTFHTLAILLSGSFLAAEGLISPGTVAAMYGYSAVFNTLLENAGFLIRSTPILKNTADRLKLFYEDAENDTGAESGPVTRICCRDLSYAYKEKQGLSPISLSVRRGEKIALCGSNGSGKSTLMKALLGLLTLYKGSILVNGRELREINPAQYRRRIAYAPQTPWLFEGTVLENVRMGNPRLSVQELQELLDKTGLGHLALRQTGPGGSGLSGGEKQKLSVVRAAARDTDLLFLDEPGNNLDRDTLDWLCDFIRKSDKTIVFISHDDALTSCAHRIILMPD